MKKHLLVIVGLFVTLLVASSGSAETGKFGFSYSGQILSGYLCNGGFKASNGAVFQNDLSFSYTTNNWGRFTLGVWGSNMLEGGFRTADGNEIDLPTIAWDNDIYKDTNLKIKYGYFDLAPLFSGNKGNMQELSIELSHKIVLNKSNSISPFMLLEWNQIAGPGQVSSNLHIGIYHTGEITQGISLNEKFAAVIDDGRGSDGGVVGLYYGALNWSVTDHISIDAPIVKITVPIAGVADRDGTQIVGGIGFNYSHNIF